MNIKYAIATIKKSQAEALHAVETHYHTIRNCLESPSFGDDAALLSALADSLATIAYKALHFQQDCQAKAAMFAYHAERENSEQGTPRH